MIVMNYADRHGDDGLSLSCRDDVLSLSCHHDDQMMRRDSTVQQAIVIVDSVWVSPQRKGLGVAQVAQVRRKTAFRRRLRSYCQQEIEATVIVKTQNILCICGGGETVKKFLCRNEQFCYR